jgi:hypothetical protein
VLFGALHPLGQERPQSAIEVDFGPTRFERLRCPRSGGEGRDAVLEADLISPCAAAAMPSRERGPRVFVAKDVRKRHRSSLSAFQPAAFGR